MALWQTDLFVVPGSKLRSSKGRIPSVIALDELDSVNWWAESNIGNSWADLLTERLNEPAVSTPEFWSWGSETGNRIDLFFNEGIVEQVRVRIDARHPDMPLIYLLTEICQLTGCLIIGDDGKVIEPSYDALISQVVGSSASSFVNSPAEFLNGLERDPDQYGGLT